MVENAAVQVQGAGVHRARLGFLSGVSVLVHTHRERLLAYARRRGLDAEDALDAVQDSFISFLELPEARTTAHESVAALKLLTVILHHNVQNQRRKRSRHQRVQTSLGTESLGDEAQSSETLIAQAEELARLKGCLSRMAQLERDVVRLSLLDDQPRDHVGQVLVSQPATCGCYYIERASTCETARSTRVSPPLAHGMT